MELFYVLVCLLLVVRIGDAVHASAGVLSQTQERLVQRLRCEKMSDREEFLIRILLCQFGLSTEFHLTSVLEFCVSRMRDLVDASTCFPLPSNGYRGRPLREPCGSPPSRVLWVRTTARLPLPATSGLPWWQVLLAEGLFASRRTPSLPSGPGSILVGLNRFARFGRDR